MTATVSGIHLGIDTHANRPAAGTPPVGSLYSCSTHSLVYRTDGSTWSTWATLGGSAVTDATISTSDVTTNNVSSTKHGWAPKGDGTTTKFLNANGAYSTPAGGGSAVVPTLVQLKKAGTAISSITMDAAPTSGNTIILGLDGFSTGQATAISSTNTTWTQIATFNSAGGGKYAIWCGVVSGVGGTAITITHPNASMSATALEIATTVAGTAGSSTTGENGLNLRSLAATTSGHLVAILTGPDNTTQISTLHPSVPAVGLFGGIVQLAACFSQGDPIYAVCGTNVAGGMILAEIT